MSNDVVRDRPAGQDTPPRVLLSIAPAERAAFFPAGAEAALATVTDRVQVIDPADIDDSTDIDADIALVAWGFPPLDAALLARMPHLRLVVNAASSVRALTTDEFWASGIPITQSGAAMAPAVAEMSLTLTLSLLRRVHRMDHALRTGGDWEAARAIPRATEISGARIGVIGASRTGRAYVQLCTALGADVRIHDPYLQSGDPLHPLATDLDDLLRDSDVLALHAPATDETAGMIGRRELALLRDGASVVNTARSTLVDDDALYDEVASGRLDAALDVFADEPLGVDDRWRSLPNALLTGHVSGATAQSRARAGAIAVDEITRFLAGDALQHAVTRADLERMG